MGSALFSCSAVNSKVEWTAQLLAKAASLQLPTEQVSAAFLAQKMADISGVRSPEWHYTSTPGGPYSIVVQRWTLGLLLFNGQYGGNYEGKIEKTYPPLPSLWSVRYFSR